MSLLIPQIQFANNGTMDAFARLRASEPATLFDVKFLYDVQPLYFETVLVGGGTSTFSSNLAAVQMATTTASGDSVTRQTFRYYNYQPGKSQFIVNNFVFSAGQTNLRQRIGYFDADNGIFLQLSGTTLSIVRRSFVTGASVDTTVAQTSWNVDPMNGNGPSGITLDITKIQLFFIDYSLGGTIRCGFKISDRLVYTHIFSIGNTLATVGISTPNLPLRCEITNTGAIGVAATMSQIAHSVISEGGLQTLGTKRRSADRGITTLAAVPSNTMRQLIAIRLKSTQIRASAFPFLASVMSTNATNILWELLLDPTFVGATAASWVSVTNSAVEYDITRSSAAGSITLGTGTLIASGYIATQGSFETIDIESGLSLAATIAGVPSELVLGVAPLGTVGTFEGSITWKELT